MICNNDGKYEEYMSAVLTFIKNIANKMVALENK